MNVFTSPSCQQCHQLLADPRIKELVRQGKMKVNDLMTINPTSRDQLFNLYNKARSVPFLVYPLRGGGYNSIVGRTQILSALKG